MYQVLYSFSKIARFSTFLSHKQTGGAKLGYPNKTMVTILKSDFPNGNFGFKGQLKFRLANPERLVQQTLSIERKGGLKGQQTVSAYDWNYKCFCIE